ncbi:MAG TPA: hypothetical protein ENK45_02370 [Aliiroseovarius sp.]|nr:hypothetical protein [Aliiroseovarius sp.]
MVQVIDVEPGIYLHLGAHRTGTGSFQAHVGANRGRLRDLGVNPVFSNRDGDSHGNLRLRMPAPRHFRANDLATHAGWIRDEFKENRVNIARATLISEENIPGTINTLFSQPIYHTLDQRLGFFCAHLKKPVRKVLFSIRCYDAFFGSAYRKRVQRRVIEPFSHYAPRLLEMKRRWPDVVADIAKVTECTDVIVVRHESRTPPPELLHLLFPDLPEQGWIGDSRRLNASPTDAACRAIQEALRAKGKRLSKDELAALIRQFADDKGGPLIAEFSPPDADRLRAMYAEDLAGLRAMPGVTLVE